MPLDMTSSILHIPFRKGTTLNLSSAVKQYISTKYDQHPDMFASDLKAVDDLREDAIHVQEPHESGIKKLAQYAAQLQWMGGKFPIDIGADFAWCPALGYNTTKAITQNNLQFERANVLYNLASLYSQLATGASRNNAQGLKSACGYYCASAGVLKYLKEDVIPELRSTPPEDMDAVTLECSQQLMLAQAQECFWLKAVVDGNKDSVVARLAASVADYYDTATEFGTKSDSITSEWVHHMSAKHCHFAAAAQYRASMDCLERSKYGEEVARLKDSLDAVNDGLKEARYINKQVLGDLIALKEKVSEMLKGAERDNDLIYLAPVPPAASLPRISRASMVSPKIPKEISEGASMLGETGPYGPPLFAKLVPFAVHVATSIYAERRDRVVNNIIDELESLTARLHELLQSLNLPGSLQALEKPLGLPPSIIAHAEEVRQQGGVEKIRSSIQDISKLRSNDVTMYQEAIELLNTERAEDERSRLRHGTDRWDRQASEVAAGKLATQMQEYDGILKSADNSDKLVRSKLTEFEGVIQLLGGRIHGLEDFVPSSSRAKLTPRMDREVGKLRQCLNEVSHLETRRRRKVEALKQKAKADDITSAILAEANRLERTTPLRKVETADFEPLFTSRLDRRYTPDKSLLDEEVLQQDELILRLRDANHSFLACRRVDSSLKDREDALQTLENGYSKYKEIISNLDVGRKFYNDLARLLQRFRDDVRAWVYSRRVEAERLEVDITNAMHDLRISTPRQEQQPPLEVVGNVRPQRGDVPTTPMPGLWNGDARTAIKFAGPPRR